MSHFAEEDLLWTCHMWKLGTFLVPPRAVVEESIFKTWSKDHRSHHKYFYLSSVVSFCAGIVGVTWVLALCLKSFSAQCLLLVPGRAGALPWALLVCMCALRRTIRVLCCLLPHLCTHTVTALRGWSSCEGVLGKCCFICCCTQAQKLICFILNLIQVS